jgi:hypothetical protein
MVNFPCVQTCDSSTSEQRYLYGDDVVSLRKMLVVGLSLFFLTLNPDKQLSQR